MWSAIASVVTVLLNFFLNKKKTDQQIINEANRASADVARTTDEEAHVQIAAVHSDTLRRTDAARHSDSLHTRNRIAADAVDSANDPV